MLTDASRTCTVRRCDRVCASKENDEDEPAASPATELDHPAFDRNDGDRLGEAIGSVPRTPSPAVGLAPSSPALYGAAPTTPSQAAAAAATVGITGSSPSPRLNAPSPPRSAGLPSSPRPGASFQSP